MQQFESREDNKNFNYYSFNRDTSFTIAEYIWIDGSNNTRSKTKVYRQLITSLDDLEIWTFDGSSTLQAVTADSEIYIKPVAMFSDPFRGKPHLLVLCETYLPDLKTTARYNFRTICNKLMNDVANHHPWFGIEQEYFLMKRTGTVHQQPIGFPEGGFPQPQGPYYCSAGDGKTFGRSIAEAHLRCCLNAGIKIHGINAEVAPGQWEYQVGVCEGIEMGDHLWMSRYILERIGEEFGVSISIQPKPLKGDWNGSGAHTNYSTEESRNDGGYELIKSKYLPQLELFHQKTILGYGNGNHERLTGKHETSSIDKFSWGDGNRGGSIRVPVMTKNNGKGYLEDRRPAANMDPYMVTALLVDSTLLKGRYHDQLIDILRQSQSENIQQQH